MQGIVFLQDRAERGLDDLLYHGGNSFSARVRGMEKMNVDLLQKGVSQVQLNLSGMRLLCEAFRICQKKGVSGYNAVVSRQLVSDLNLNSANDAQTFILSNTEVVRTIVKTTLYNAARMVSGVWRTYFDEMYAAFEECGGYWSEEGEVRVCAIDMDRRMDCSERGIGFRDVRTILEELQVKSDAWKSRKLPTFMTPYRLHHFLKRCYAPRVRRFMRDLDLMRPDAVRGFTEFYKDNMDIISAFGCMDDRRIPDFVKLTESFIYAFGMGRLYRSLEYVHGNMFKMDDEQTAVALMGHEVSLRELMKWVLGHRLTGLNLVRMHGDLTVRQIGSAEENLLRARYVKDLGMAQAVVAYLDEEVSIEKGDPIAEHARLILLKEAIQVARGLYGEDLEPMRLAGNERRVDEQIDALEETLRSRAKRLNKGKKS